MDSATITDDTTNLKIWLCIALFLVVVISITLPILIFIFILKRSRSEQPSNTHVNVNEELPILSSTSFFSQERIDRVIEKVKIHCSRLTCLAAGIFLGAALLDVYPDCKEAFDEYFLKVDPTKDSLVYASLSIFAGFSLILVIESIAEGLLHNKEASRQGYVRHLNNESFENHENETLTEMENLSVLRNIIIIIALSVHSVFEGLSIGLVKSSTDIWSNFIAISLHKTIISITLGLRILPIIIMSEDFVINLRKMAVQLSTMFMFSIASPVGIITGCFVTSNGRIESNLTKLSIAILQGLAGGTFLYIVFAEMLQENLFDRQIKGWEKNIRIILFIFGISIISLFIIYL